MKNSGIEEAKKRYLEAKQAVEDCQKLISELTRKYDTTEEETKLLSEKVNGLEKEETDAFDNYVIGKITEKEFEKFKNEYQAIKNKHAENNKMLESLHRGIKRVEGDFVKLNAVCEAAKRECWQAIFGEIEKTIPAETIEAIQRLIICRSQTGGTRQHVLNMLIPQLNPGDYQGIRDELMEKFEITD